MNRRDDTPDLLSTFPSLGRSTYDGLVKLKLVHSKGSSVLLPDVVLAQFGDWKYFQPHYFGPCQLAFIDDQAYGQMDIDVLSGPKLLVGWTASRLVRRFADGSQLYRCKIASIEPPRLFRRLHPLRGWSHEQTDAVLT